MEKDLKYLYSLCNRINSFGSIIENTSFDPSEYNENEQSQLTGQKDTISFYVSNNPAAELIEDGRINFVLSNFDINVYLNQDKFHKKFLDNHLCGILSNYKIDKKFIETQSNYIKNLSTNELKIINYYTTGGDTTMNSILSGNFDENFNINNLRTPADVFLLGFITEPYLKDKTIYENQEIVDSTDLSVLFQHFTYDFLKSVLLKACDILQEIIKKSPPVTKIMKVFRAAKERKRNLKYIKNGKIYYKNERFVSTSLDPNSALRFANKEPSKTDIPNSNIKVITLLPGSRGLFLAGVSDFPDEFEVLLPNDTTYLIRDRKACNQLVSGYHISKKQNIYVEDIVVVS
jgi:hypothetical protein